MSTSPAALSPDETRQLQRLLPGVIAGEPTALRTAHRMLGSAIARIDDPVSIKAVPHSQWPPRGFTRCELASSYCGWNDRFVVGLIVSYGDEVLDAREACASALALVRDEGGDGTRWYVWDRATQEMFTFVQGELDRVQEPVEAPDPAGGVSTVLTLELLTPDECAVAAIDSLDGLIAAVRAGAVAVRVLRASTGPVSLATYMRRAEARSGDATLTRPLRLIAGEAVES